MSLFLSTYTIQIDKKNRISIPVSFRSVLAEESYAGVIMYQSIKNPCIEGCGISRIEELSRIIQYLDPYSPERDAFETIMLGGSTQVPFDSEGRIIVPKDLINYAKLENQVSIVGKGQVFEIWNPETLTKHISKAKDIAFANKLLLKNIINGDKTNKNM